VGAAKGIYMNYEPDVILALSGVALSLVFGYLPMVKDWYDNVPSQYKPLLMAGILLLVTAGKLVVDCEGSLACMGANWQAALWGWFGALIANQTTYLVGVRQVRQAQEDAASAPDDDIYSTMRN